MQEPKQLPPLGKLPPRRNSAPRATGLFLYPKIICLYLSIQLQDGSSKQHKHDAAMLAPYDIA